MKIYKIILGVISLLSVIAPIFAKNSYYYYNGERVPLQLSEDSVTVYTYRRDNGVPIYEYRNILNHQNSITQEDSVASVEYIIKGSDGTSVKMSNRFYVQLYDAISDVLALQSIAEETNVVIIGQIPYMPDWYELEINNSTINNSLEMSNYYYETGLFKDVDPGFIFQFSPSCVTDSYFSSQWGLPAINACDAWGITKGDSNVKIAIIDKGIERYHTEFPLSKFMYPYDCDSRTSAGYHVYDEHGTHVCGVIMADHNHAQIAGVAPNCNIIPISFSTNNTSMTAANLASGFAWAVSHGADVINCSWGDHHTYTWLHSSLLESAIQDALTNGRNGKGCVVVFAAGNQNTLQLDYPAYVFPDIITVGAIQNDMTRWESSSSQGSDYGYDLDVVAPGCQVLTTDIWDDAPYINVMGTSIAAPHVSGLAGLILSVSPFLSQKEVADIIESTAQKVHPNGIIYDYSTTEGRPNGTWNLELGYGLIDADMALQTARNKYIQGPDIMCDTAKFYLIYPHQSGETVTWSVNNGSYDSPVYSIVGSNSQDTVLIVCTEYELPAKEGLDSTRIMGANKYLSVTISSNSGSNTYTKSLRHTKTDIPTISASSFATLWIPNTTRTFTITNCIGVPDSLLQWTVKKIIPNHLPSLPPAVVTNYYYGRTLTYTSPNVKLGQQDSLNIYATNLSGDCGPAQSNIYQFVVSRQFHFLSGYVDGGQLVVSIYDESDDQEHLPAQLDENCEYTLEFEHSIYGRMVIRPINNAIERLNISALPQGVYILSLKANGCIIAQTKVQI